MLRFLGIASALMVLACCAQSQAEMRPAQVAPAETHARQMLAQMVGRWELSGVIAGENTTHDVVATWALQRKYVEIREVSRERPANGEPAYEAIVYVGWLRDHYVCFWFDNTDVAATDVQCQASATSPNAIPFVFRNGQGQTIFFNTFEYQPVADTWTWRMESPQGAGRETFGLVTLRRR